MEENKFTYSQINIISDFLRIIIGIIIVIVIIHKTENEIQLKYSIGLGVFFAIALFFYLLRIIKQRNSYIELSLNYITIKTFKSIISKMEEYDIAYEEIDHVELDGFYVKFFTKNNLKKNIKFEGISDSKKNILKHGLESRGIQVLDNRIRATRKK